MFPWDKKASSRKKMVKDKYEFNSFDDRMLSHDRWLWFFLGALTGPYPTLRFGGACGLGVNISRMDVDPKRLSQEDGFEQRMPKT